MKPIKSWKREWIEDVKIPFSNVQLSLSNVQFVILVICLVLTTIWVLRRFIFGGGSRLKDSAVYPKKFYCLFSSEFYVGHLKAFMALFKDGGKYADSVVQIYLWGMPGRLASIYYFSSAETITKIKEFSNHKTRSQPRQSSSLAAMRGFVAYYKDRFPSHPIFSNVLLHQKDSDRVAAVFSEAYGSLKIEAALSATSKYIDERLGYWISSGGSGSLEDCVSYFRKGILCIFTAWFLQVFGARNTDELLKHSLSIVQLFMKISPTQLSRQALNMWNKPELGKIDEIYQKLENVLLAAIPSDANADARLAALFLLLTWSDRVMPTWFAYSLFLVSNNEQDVLAEKQTDDAIEKAYENIHSQSPLSVVPLYISRNDNTFEYAIPSSNLKFRYAVAPNSLLLWDKQASSFSSEYPKWLPEPPVLLSRSIIKHMITSIAEKFDFGFELSSFYWVDQLRHTGENHAFVYGFSTIADQLRGKRRVGYKKEALTMWYCAR